MPIKRFECEWQRWRQKKKIKITFDLSQAIRVSGSMFGRWLTSNAFWPFLFVCTSFNWWSVSFFIMRSQPMRFQAISLLLPLAMPLFGNVTRANIIHQFEMYKSTEMNYEPRAHTFPNFNGQKKKSKPNNNNNKNATCKCVQ